MTTETMARCAELENITKYDVNAAVGRATEQRLACGEDFCQLSGEDVTQMGFRAQGGVGCISVTANVAPKLVSEMHEAWQAGKAPMRSASTNCPRHCTRISSARQTRAQPNMRPVCWASSEELRLPLVPIMEESAARSNAPCATPVF